MQCNGGEFERETETNVLDEKKLGVALNSFEIDSIQSMESRAEASCAFISGRDSDLERYVPQAASVPSWSDSRA
jgi:hypothetical protein